MTKYSIDTTSNTIRKRAPFECLKNKFGLKFQTFEKKYLICAIVGYLHSIFRVNCAAMLKMGKFIFLSVMLEKCPHLTIFTCFLLIKSVWFKIRQTFLLIMISGAKIVF